MKRRDILFLCQFFYPEYNSSATLPFDTARYLVSRGYSVDALVGYPKEYRDGASVPLRETVEGVRIHRLRYLQPKRARKLLRLVNYFSFTFHAFLHLPALRRYRCVFVYSNPPVLPVVPILARILYGTRFVFIAYDVYPETAYSSGSLSPGGLISRVMFRINHALCSRVDAVVALTDEMRAFLLRARPELDEARVVTIPNWAHETGVCVEKPDPALFGFQEGDFIVSYLGNMGICQDMDSLLRAADLLRNDSRVRFLLAGFGNKMDSIREQIREKQLKNVRLTGHLVGDSYERALAASSCFVVTLERGLIGTCAPSKYYSYLRGGRPILSVTEPESYLAEEVGKEKIGLCVETGDAEGLQDAILYLAAHAGECLEMGQRAVSLYRKQYDYPLAMEKYHRLVRHILGR